MTPLVVVANAARTLEARSLGAAVNAADLLAAARAVAAERRLFFSLWAKA